MCIYNVYMCVHRYVCILMPNLPHFSGKRRGMMLFLLITVVLSYSFPSFPVLFSLVLSPGVKFLIPYTIFSSVMDSCV